MEHFIKFGMKHIYSKSLWSSSLPHDIWPWVALKGQIKVIGLCIIDHVLLDRGAVRLRGLLFKTRLGSRMAFQFISWPRTWFTFGQLFTQIGKIWPDRTPWMIRKECSDSQFFIILWSFWVNISYELWLWGLASCPPPWWSHWGDI